MKIKKHDFLIFIVLINCNLIAQKTTSNESLIKLDSMRLIYGLTEVSDSMKRQVFIDSLMTSANHATNRRLFNLAIQYLEMAEYAAIFYIGENSIAHARILYSFGFSYARNNAFVKAEPYLEKALGIYENHYGWACEKCAKTLNTLGFVYHFQGKYDKVEACLEKSVSIYEKLYGKYQSDYINSLNSLCIFLKESGQYERALQKFPELLELNEKLFSKQNNNYISALINFSNLLVELDQFEKAEELRLEAVQISENLNGKQNMTYALALFTLANFYKSINQTEKAEMYLIETQKIYEILNLTNLPEYARVLNNLGNLYVSFDRSAIAESYLLNSSKILENVLGKKHFEYAQSLENMALLKSKLKFFDEAERLFKDALQIKLESRGKNNDYTTTLIFLARLYLELNRSEQAQILLEESLNIRLELFGSQHQSVAESLNLLSEAYHRLGKYDLSDSCRKIYFEVIQDIFGKAMRYMSKKELQVFTNNYLNDLNQSLQFYFERKEKSIKLSEICYNIAIFYKGFLLNDILAQKNFMLSQPKLKDAYASMLVYSRQLAAQYTKPINDRTNVKELEEKIEQKEKELSKIVSGFGLLLQKNNWESVRSRLKEDEVAIEFVHYRVRNIVDSVRYAAILLSGKQQGPEIVSLCSEAELVALFRLTQKKGHHLAALYNSLDGSIAVNSKNLFQLVWSPLELYLSGTKNIYYSLSGLLHKLNFSTIVYDKQIQLLDKYHLFALQSTRQLTLNDNLDVTNQIRQAELWGGIQYDIQDPNRDSKINTSHDFVAVKRSLSFERSDTSLGIASWNYLPGSLKEVKQLSAWMHKAKIETKLYTAHLADESIFKNSVIESNSSQIIHFATHGFFYPDRRFNSDNTSVSQSVFQKSEDPMVRSGLILSNANFAWKFGVIPEQLEEDGVLTALEISQLNLTKVKLVVLSACETGLGEITDYEGVYGLQRAFKIAGAKYLIMSLWQIPDRETKEFMVSFYKNWLQNAGPGTVQKKISISEAFRKTQKEMRERFINPYAWAGFVLVE